MHGEVAFRDNYITQDSQIPLFRASMSALSVKSEVQTPMPHMYPTQNLGKEQKFMLHLIS